MFHDTEPRVVAVLDWELATLGHPLSDLCNCCLSYFLPDSFPVGVLSGPHRPAGIPSFEEMVELYHARRELQPPAPGDLLFAVTFALFRMAVILQGVGYRAAKGQASSSRAELMASFAQALARAAFRGAATGRLDAIAAEDRAAPEHRLDAGAAQSRL